VADDIVASLTGITAQAILNVERTNGTADPVTAMLAKPIIGTQRRRLR